MRVTAARISIWRNATWPVREFRKDVQAALRCLATAVGSGWEDITEAELEEAQALMDTLRPRAV